MYNRRGAHEMSLSKVFFKSAATCLKNQFQWRKMRSRHTYHYFTFIRFLPTRKCWSVVYTFSFHCLPQSLEINIRVYEHSKHPQSNRADPLCRLKAYHGSTFRSKLRHLPTIFAIAKVISMIMSMRETIEKCVSLGRRWRQGEGWQGGMSKNTESQWINILYTNL